jgi:DNA-binding CsgD family transcriptional regulator/tetratricopeptide (TPR) repeat protein
VPERVWSSTFVGRAAQLAGLEAALEEAVEGRPALVFVAGDSGVGKTRLLSEFAARARDRGARVLAGDCIELGEGELPYAPVVAVLRSLARDRDPVLEEIPQFARSELAALLPELGDGAPRDPRPMEESDQGRLFEALLWLLERVGDATPAVLAIEDLHWADRATRAFLAFLGRNLATERLLVVATYRADELHRRHPVRPLLAELERLSVSRRIELPALTRAELSLQLTSLLGAVPDEDLVERVFARTEGYPLFVEELVAASADGRGRLPTTLRDALMGRVERLPASAQSVLSALAVGQRLDEELLAEVTGLDEGDLTVPLREALASNILLIESDGRYRFRHALLREVVADDLLPGERRAIDLRLAQALEQRAERDGMTPYLAAAIANHFASAGDRPAALRAAVRAADAAVLVHAYGQAAALFEHAVELFDRVPDAEEVAGIDRAELLARAAMDHKLEGNSVRQETLARAALAEIDEQVEPHRAARFLDTLQDAQWHLGRGEESLATLQRALSLVACDDVSFERGSLLRSWALSMMLRGRNSEAIDAARESLRIAESLDAVRLRNRALNALGTALMNLGELDTGAAALREALEVAKREGFVSEQNSGYVNLGDALHLGGRLTEARALVDEGLAKERPGNWVWLVILQGELAIEAGDWERAEEILGALRRRPNGNGLVNLDLRRAELALGRGQHELARELLDEAAQVGAGMDEPQFSGVLAALRAELDRRAGDLESARRAVSDTVDRLVADSEEGVRLARVIAVGTAVEADAAQRARDLGDAEGERIALDVADAYLARTPAPGEARLALEGAWSLVARAERERAAGRADPSAYGGAADTWTELGRPYPAAVMRFRQSEAFVEAGERGLALSVAREAHATAVRLGAAWLRGEIEGLAARGRLRLTEAAGAEESRNGDVEVEVDDPFGLTRRERQVLELVARGATNREIGEELFMAEKTASVHVSRILAKLGVRSRTEAAGLAHRLGLAA